MKHTYIILISIMFLLLLIDTEIVVAVDVSSSINTYELYPNEDVNFSLIIGNYPISKSIIIQIETDLVDPDFLVKCSGNVSIYKQAIKIYNLTDSKIYIKISGKSPTGKDVRYININEYGFYTISFDEGPYRYYEIKIFNINGDVLDKKMTTFKLKFKELERFNDLLDDVKDPNVKEFAKDLLKCGLYDYAIRLLEIYPKDEQSYLLTVAAGIGCFVIGIMVGYIKWSKIKIDNKKPPR